ncbi:MAG: hypothetical protein ACRD1T_09620, partial [Acidimicrobiia bacterium]
GSSGSPGSSGDRTPLVPGSGRTTARIRSILNAIGGIVIGAGIFLIGALISSIFTGRPSDLVVLGAISFLCAGGGVGFGILNWRAWNREFYLSVSGAGLEIAYVGFREPMRVPRESVRVVAVDESGGPAHRFPLSEKTPTGRDTSRTDTTAQQGRQPRDPYASPFVDVSSGDRGPQDPGWAAPVPTSESKFMDRARDPDYLYSLTNSHGPRGESGLPFLKLNPEDTPNVAIVFNEDLSMPKSPPGVDFPGGGIWNGAGVFGGGRKVPGVMISVVDAARVRAALEEWKVVRPISAQDVFEGVIFHPSRFTPRIKGALVAVGILIMWILRVVFDLDEFGLMNLM